MSEKYMLLLSCEDDILQKDIEYHIRAIVKGILVLKQYKPTRDAYGTKPCYSVVTLHSWKPRKPQFDRLLSSGGSLEVKISILN